MRVSMTLQNDCHEKICERYFEIFQSCIQCNPLIWNGSGPPLYPEKPYKLDSPIPIPIHTQESVPGDPTLYADVPCI